MSVYVDPLMACVSSKRWPWSEACHLVVEPGGVDELHGFARRLGLKREWFQDNGIALPHYDLTAGKRAAAVRMGAVEIDRGRMGRIMAAWRAHGAMAEGTGRLFGEGAHR